MCACVCIVPVILNLVKSALFPQTTIPAQVRNPKYCQRVRPSGKASEIGRNRLLMEYQYEGTEFSQFHTLKGRGKSLLQSLLQKGKVYYISY